MSLTLALILVLAAALLAALIVWLLLGGRHAAQMQLQQSTHLQALSATQQELAGLAEKHKISQQQYLQAEQQLASVQAAFSEQQRQLVEAQTLNKQLPQLQQQLADYSQRWQAGEQRALDLQSRNAAAQTQIAHLEKQEQALVALRAEYAQLQQALEQTRVENERLRTQWRQAEQTQAEKLALLQDARESLGHQFQQLAQKVLEEKSQNFSRQTQENLGQLLNPLNQQISQFGQLIQNTYEKDTRERSALEVELKRLQSLNTQLHGDAKALTQALLGSRNKTQGNWGEIILESVLEHSGLTRGREYIVQAASTRQEEDGSIRRLQPDVLINLPDGKQIVIDSKVSLTAYVRHVKAEDAASAEAALREHVASVRGHMRELSLKNYSQLDGVNTLDFVFMFIPVEPAYLLALQHDDKLFNDCFEKRIMLVGPSTLLATLRTIANIWRNEQQNRNAQEIADEGSKLYDKFVGFVETLERVGKNLNQAQNDYQQAFSQLSEGRGNLVRRVEKLKALGVRSKKNLSTELLEKAEHNHLQALNAPLAKDKEENA